MPQPDPPPAFKLPQASDMFPRRGDTNRHRFGPVAVAEHRLIRTVGAGSYGEVWLAKNTLGQYRAVKILHREAFEDDRPFEREFAGIKRFEPVSRLHESQLNILQVGRGEGFFYYVMELADDMWRGSAIEEASYSPRSLRSELLMHGRLPMEECIRLGLALTTALEHLHRNGLVHRDIKPSNIIFVNGIPKLADIGLVAQAERTMSFVGTQGYLPPEGPGTVQADVFSLGKVLYEIVTGNDRQQFPDLPSDVAEMPNPQRLAELNEVLVRACAPNPRERYESAAEMHADLALLQSGKSISRIRQVERRLRLVARAGALVTVLALVASGAFIFQGIQTREARRLADENRTLAQENSHQLARFRIANGARALDENNPAAALLWFAEALPLVSSQTGEESIHRIRIQQALDRVPRLTRVLPHESGLMALAIDPQDSRIATTTIGGRVQLWDLKSGAVVWSTPPLGPTFQISFSCDGALVFVSSVPAQGEAGRGWPLPAVLTMLDAETGKEIWPATKTIPDLSTNLLTAEFSPNAQVVATSRIDEHVIRLYTVRGEPTQVLEGHTGRVQVLAFSMDGGTLASGSSDRTVRLWELPKGQSTGVTLEHNKTVRRIVFSDDGRRIATGSKLLDSDCVIQVWSLPDGRKLGPPIVHPGNVPVLFFEPGLGQRLFTRGDDDSNKVWDLAPASSYVPRIEIDTVFKSWAFSPDRKTLGIGGVDGTASIWDLNTGHRLFGPFNHTRWVNSVAFTSDGQKFATAGDDKTVKVWSLSGAPNPVARIQEKGVGVFGGSRLINCGPGLVGALLEGMLRVYRKDTMAPLSIATPWAGESDAQTTNRRTGVVASRGDFHDNSIGPVSGTNVWAVPRFDGKSPEMIYVFRTVHHELQTSFTLAHPAAVTRMWLSPAEDYLLTYGEDRKIRTWSTRDGNLLKSLEQIPPEGDLEDFDPTGTRALWHWPPKLVQGRALQRSFQLLNLHTGDLEGTKFSARVPGAILRARFNPAGDRIALQLKNGEVEIIDPVTGRPTTAPFQHTDNLEYVEWSPDGTRLLTAGDSEAIVVWDAVSGQQSFAALRGSRLAHWSADGQLIITRNEDASVQVWDGATGEPVTPRLQQPGPVWDVALDGNRIIVGTAREVRALNLGQSALDSSVLIDYARYVSGRRLVGAAMLPLDANAIAGLEHSLRTRAPQFFTD